MNSEPPKAQAYQHRKKLFLAGSTHEAGIRFNIAEQHRLPLSEASICSNPKLKVLKKKNPAPPPQELRNTGQTIAALRGFIDENADFKFEA